MADVKPYKLWTFIELVRDYFEIIFFVLDSLYLFIYYVDLADGETFGLDIYDKYFREQLKRN